MLESNIIIEASVMACSAAAESDTEHRKFTNNPKCLECASLIVETLLFAPSILLDYSAPLGPVSQISCVTLYICQTEHPSCSFQCQGILAWAGLRVFDVKDIIPQ